MIISQKDELYSYDEIKAVEAFLPENMKALASAITDRNKQAIFFMPQESYAMFSIFGQTAVCNREKDDIKDILDKCADCQLPPEIRQKLTILNDFLQQGNKVFPVVTAADNLIEV